MNLGAAAATNLTKPLEPLLHLFGIVLMEQPKQPVLKAYSEEVATHTHWLVLLSIRLRDWGRGFIMFLIVRLFNRGLSSRYVCVKF